MHADFPDRVVVARNGSPLLVGVGDKEMFIASDLAALVRHTTTVAHLADGELATVTASGSRPASPAAARIASRASATRSGVHELRITPSAISSARRTALGPSAAIQIGTGTGSGSLRAAAGALPPTSPRIPST